MSLRKEVGAFWSKVRLARRSTAAKRQSIKQLGWLGASHTSFESLETRILFGFDTFRGPEIAQPGPPQCYTCGGTGGPVASAGNGSMPSALMSTTAPVGNASGTPMVDSIDLSSDAFGQTWGHVRSWTGLNESSLNGNGWMVKGLPYATLVFNQGIGTHVHDGFVSIVLGSGDTREFTIGGDASTFTPRYQSQDTFVYVPPSIDPNNNNKKLPGEFRLTDSMGNVTTFYDLPRRGSSHITDDPHHYGGLFAGNGYTQEPTNQWFDTTKQSGHADFYQPDGATDTYRFGAFKGYTAASGKLTVTTTYNTDGNLTSVQRTDGSGSFEQFYYEYDTWTNPNASATLVSQVSMQRGASASGPWTTIRSAQYDYYTGDDSGNTKKYGRLGDLKHVVINDHQRVSTGEVVEEKFYRYNKLLGNNPINPNDGWASGYATRGPTNHPSTTGGTDMTFVPLSGSPGNIVMSGLSAVFEGASFDRLVAARGTLENFQDDSDLDLNAFANNVFKYERVQSHPEGNGLADTRYRVVEEVAAADGCSTCSNGFGTFGYDYHVGTTFSRSDAFQSNSWTMRTTEYFPDLTNARMSRTVATGELTSTGLYWPSVQTSKFHLGNRIKISGANESEFNGVFEIVNIGSDSITLNLPSTVPATATGTIKAENLDVIDPAEWQDNDSKIVYTNELGQPMLSVFTDRHTESGGNKSYFTYYRYDDAGRLIAVVHPSALKGFNASLPDLVDYESPESPYVRQNEGLIDLYDYATQTPSNLEDGDDLADVDGDVAGYFKSFSQKRGAAGAAVTLTSRTYYKKTYDGVTIYPVARDIAHWDVNRDGDMADPEDSVHTRHTYTWRSDGSSGVTNGVAALKVTLPTVATSRNGSGATTSVTTVFDDANRPIWTKDADGHINFYAYYNDSGAVMKTITDVKYSSLTAGEQTLFDATDWSKSTSGLHLATNYVADGLGRPTKINDPNGKDTYIVYKDAAHEIRTYRGLTGGMTTGPIEVTREYRAGTPDVDGDGRVYTETLTFSATPSVDGNGKLTGNEAITKDNIQSLTRTLTNDAGQVVKSDVYHSMAGIALYDQESVAFGSPTNDSSGNRHRTLYDYDGRGRLKRLEMPNGTITRTQYDARGLATSIWVGTDDTPTSGFWSPTNMAGTNLTKVQENEYDVSGNLTRATRLADVVEGWIYSSSPNSYAVNGEMGGKPTDYFVGYTMRIVAGVGKGEVRISGNNSTTFYHDGDFIETPGVASRHRTADERTASYHYDWRNRLVLTKFGGVGSDDEDDADQSQMRYCELDNLGREIACEWYVADREAVSDADPDGSGPLLPDGVPDKPYFGFSHARTEQRFDEQGRVYHTRAFADYPVNTGPNVLDTDIWYDARGNVIKTKVPTGVVTKSTYDGANRLTATFVSDGGNDSEYSHASHVLGDTVLEQTEYGYDANGNVTLTTFRQRFHDAAETGELGTPASTSPTAKARVSYTASYYDAANRLTAEVNFGANGGSLDGSGAGADLDANNDGSADRPAVIPGRSNMVLVNNYEYDAAGRLWKVIDPKEIEDRTEYDLLGRTTATIEHYVDGDPSDADDRITRYTYNGNNQVKTLTADLPGSQDQTTEYVYGVSPLTGSLIYSNDLLAEVRYPDKTTGLPGTTDGDKERYAYNAVGEVILMTDRNGNTHAYQYDTLGRRRSDAVTALGTGVDGSVRRIETGYDVAGRENRFTSYNAASGGSVVNEVTREFNYLGQLTTEYQAHAGAVDPATTPKVQYAYDTSNIPGGTGVPSVMTKGSRPVSMTYPNGRVLNYNYDGSALDEAISRLTSLSDASATLESYSYLGLSTMVERKHPQSGVNLTYVGTGTSDAGDQYVGLDRFGRVADQNWKRVSDDTSADRFAYTYDRNSNRLSRDWTATGNPGTMDEVYSYDSLDRLTKMERGTYSAGTLSNVNHSRDWTSVNGNGLDALGNWQSVTTTTNGSSTSQTRTHNGQNQITGISGATPPVFDANGSMTTDETGKTFVYDAWNRTVQAKAPGGATLITYQTDALGRRIVAAPAGGAARHDYFSEAWQVIEEREGATPKTQYVWSPAYVDAMVLRDQISSAGPVVTAGSLDTSFSTDGKLTFNVGSSNDEVRAVRQSNGKIVVAGVSGGNIKVVRFNADGTLDTSFGTGGVVTTDFGGIDTAQGIALQADGKILVVGRTSSGSDITVARYTTSGSLDTSFDTDGKKTIDFTGLSASGADIAVDSSGKILVAGDVSGNGVVVRLTSAGALDTTYAGGAGYRTVDFGGTDWSLRMTLDGSGRAVVAGMTSVGGDATVFRLTTSGDLDTTFSTDGKTTIDFGSSGDEASGIEIDSSGRIVLGGTGGANNDLVAARLLSDGTLDTSFSGDGLAYADFGPGADEGEDLAIDSAGRIVIGGTANDDRDFAVARFNTDGSLDTSFDTDGKVTIDFAGGTVTETAEAMVLQSDGKIVIAGRSNGDFAVARLNGITTTADTRHYVIHDANYNVTAVTDASGSVVERYQYDPYGAFTILDAGFGPDSDSSSDVNWKHLHQGGAHEAATGLYFYNISGEGRDYSPTLGQWGQQDRKHYADSMNLYGYLQGSPINSVDPMGTETSEAGLSNPTQGAVGGSNLTPELKEILKQPYQNNPYQIVPKSWCPPKYYNPNSPSMSAAPSPKPPSGISVPAPVTTFVFKQAVQKGLVALCAVPSELAGAFSFILFNPTTMGWNDVVTTPPPTTQPTPPATQPAP